MRQAESVGLGFSVLYVRNDKEQTLFIMDRTQWLANPFGFKQNILSVRRIMFVCARVYLCVRTYVRYSCFKMNRNKTNSVALVSKRTIPTEGPPLVGEVSANFSGVQTWKLENKT
jgi:hypothetical protein